MINSSDHSLPLGRPSHISKSGNNVRPATPNKPLSAGADSLALNSAADVRSKLESLPIVRPEKVEAAKALVVSPNYPPLEIIRRIAETLVASPDLTDVSENS